MKTMLRLVLLFSFAGASLWLTLAANGAVSAQPQRIADTCPGAPKSRLIVGQYGVVSPTPKGQQPSPDKVHDSPSAKGAVLFTMTDGTPFQVVDGPKCAEGFIWWKIHTTNGDGWLAEGNATSYFIDPVTVTGTPPAAANFSCNGALPTRLAVGAAGVARVLAVNVRADAGKAARQLNSLPAGRQFTVIDGPKCADGSVWWKVQASQASGWIAEDDGTGYFVDPVGVPIPSQTPPPTPSPAPTVPPSPTPRINIALAADSPTFSFGNPVYLGLFWSPQGSAILAVADGQPAIFSVKGDQQVDLSNSSCTSGTGGSFSGWTPDGNLLCTSPDAGTAIYDPQGKNQMAFFAVQDASKQFPPPSGMSCPCQYYTGGFFRDGRYVFASWFKDQSQRLGIQTQAGKFVQWLPYQVPANVAVPAITLFSALNNDLLLLQQGTHVSLVGLDGSVKGQFDAGAAVSDHSADGSVLLAHGDTQLLLYATDGKALATIPAAGDFSGFLSADGKRVVVSNHGQNAMVYDSTGAFQGNISIDDGRSVDKVAWAPDSTTLAVVSGGSVWVVPLPN